jgi:hypothetical protein
MLIDAREMGMKSALWQVYHAELCKLLKNVVWVNDETHQFATWASDYNGSVHGGY